jgi:NitT/TauT family transport system ATP-binding protein
MKPEKIKVCNISKSYMTENKQVYTALQNVSTEIYEGEFISVIGPSGCGKTTLLSVIAGLLQPSSGEVFIDGRPVTGPSSERGVVFQQDAIFPWRKVLQNVEFGLELQKVPKEQRRDVAMRQLSLVGLEKYANFYPKELSGGMKKKVAIAMVLANNPEVLLMDEPFGALDYVTKVSLQKELLNIWEKEKKTTIFITHDIEEALFLADRILVFKHGALAQVYGVPFERPRTDGLRSTAEFQKIKDELWQYFYSE